MSTIPLLVLVLVLRAVLQARAASSGGRADSKRNELLFLVVLRVLLVSSLLLMVIGRPLGPAQLLFVPLLALLLPGQLVRVVLVPAGWVKAAYYCSRVPTLGWINDGSGGALAQAAWALLCRRPDAERRALAAWLEDRAGRAIPARGGTLLAASLLSAARGDPSGARRLAEGLEALDPVVCPPLALGLARELCVGLALERGDWAEVARLSERPGRRSPRLRLLGHLARHRLGRARLGRLRPAAWWLLGGRWRFTARLWREARCCPFGQDGARPREAMELYLDPEQDALARALRFQLALGRVPPARLAAEDLACAAELWRAARAAPPPGVEARAQALGLPGAEAALGEVSRRVEEELARALLSSGLPVGGFLAGEGPLGLAAARIRHELLTRVEDAADALTRRTQARRALPAFEERREVLALFAAVEELEARVGPDLGVLVHPVVHVAATNHAVWLFNDRHERAVANASFGWLLDFALRAGDERAAEILRGNVACGAS